MSIESLLGLQDFGADVDFCSNDSVLINTKVYDRGSGNIVLLETEPFKNLDAARRILNFRKWMYLGATFLTMTVGSTTATSLFFSDNSLKSPPPLWVPFLAGFAVRMGINTLIESTKAKRQLEKVEEYYS